LARKTDIRLRRSNTEAAIPTHSNLSDGELAMNTKDGALYFKKSDNTIITAHDDTIMHIDSSNRAVKLFETVKRDSNNTAYTTGDAAGFEYKEAVKIFSDSDEGVIDLSRTISNGGDRDVATRIRCNGLSYFKDRLSVNTHLDFGGPLNISSYSDRFIFMRGFNNNSSNADVNLIELRQSINSTTNTTSSGVIKIFTSTDGTQSTPILLSSDPDTNSVLTTDLVIDGQFLINPTTVADVITIGSTAGTGPIAIGRSTKTQSVEIADTGVESGATKTVDIGGGTSAGTTNINIGSSDNSGTQTVNIYGNTTLTGNAADTMTVGSATQTGTITLGQSTATNTINIGNAATASGSTQTINIGGGNVAGGDTILNLAANTTLAADTTVTIGNSNTTGTHAVAIRGTTTFSNGNVDVEDAFTANSVASDTTVATGAFVLPNAAGTEGQVLQWPSSGTTLTWATDVDAVNAIGMARSLGWVPGNGHSTATAVVWNDSQSAVELKPSGSATTGIIHKAFRVYAGQKIHATIHIKPASTGAANGLYAFLYKHDGNLPAGKTHVGNGGTADAQVQAADSSQAFSTVNNLAPAAGWNSYTTEYTPASDGYVSLALNTTTTIGTTSIYFKQPVVANAGIGIGDVIAIQYLLG